MSIKVFLKDYKIKEVPFKSVDRLFGGKSTFKPMSWIREYLKWFIWGIKNAKKIKKYLVTGGLGFIGSAISNHLITKGHEVIVFDNLTRGRKRRILIKNKNLKIIYGDIRNYKKVFNSCKGVDAVIHLAYINGTKFFYSKPTEILEIGIKGIINILDSCKKHKIKELILASSSEVYQTPKKIPTNEKEVLKIPDIYNPRYSYGGGKILTELMGIHYGKIFQKINNI